MAAQRDAGEGAKCRASATSDPPQDCDMPFCGCDPAFHAVIQALQESGWCSREEAERPACGWCGHPMDRTVMEPFGWICACSHCTHRPAEAPPRDAAEGTAPGTAYRCPKCQQHDLVATVTTTGVMLRCPSEHYAWGPFKPTAPRDGERGETPVDECAKLGRHVCGPAAEGVEDVERVARALFEAKEGALYAEPWRERWEHWKDSEGDGKAFRAMARAAIAALRARPEGVE